MSSHWERLADGGLYSVADFEQAAYALMVQQALYASDNRQRTSYHVVRSHLAAFRNLFASFGVDIVDEPTDQYVVAVPRNQRLSQLSKDMTLLVLTAAQIFHQQMTRGEIDGDKAVVTIEEFRSAYRALADRDLPADVGSLRQLLQQTQRMGMTKMIDAEGSSPQPFDIAILPAIKSLVSEATLMRFAAAYQAMNEKGSPGEDESDEDAEGDAHEAA